MKSTYIVALAILFCLAFGFQSAEAVVGDLDTIRVTGGPLVVGQSHPIKIELFNDETIDMAAFTPTLRSLSGGNAQFDSLRFVGRLADPTVMPIRLVFPPTTTSLLAVVFYRAAGNPIPAGDGAIIEAWYTGTTTGDLDFILGWTDHGGTTELHPYMSGNPGETIYEPFVWLPNAFEVLGADDFPQLESISATHLLALGDSLDLTAAISYPGSEELTASVEMSLADDHNTTPVNQPSLSGETNLTIGWSPTAADLGVWELSIEACTESGLCDTRVISVQVVESADYMLSFNEDVASGISKPSSLQKGQFDSDPSLEVAVVGEGNTNQNSFDLYDAASLSHDFSKYDSRIFSAGAVAFLDSDNHLDLVTVLNNNGDHFVCGQLGDGNNGFTEVLGVQDLGYARGGTTAEINGDQYIDFIVVTHSGIALLAGDGDGTFTQLPGISADSRAATAADFNNDGKVDLAIGTPDAVEIHLGNGAGQFSYLTEYPQTYGAIDIEVTNNGSDFDGDNIYDLCISTPSIGGEYSELVVYFGNGDGTFQAETVRTIMGTVLGNAVGDLNLDGNLDICYLNGANRYVGVLYGDGQGGFDNEARYVVDAGVPAHVALLDRDLDGDLDIVVAASGFEFVEPSSLIIFENQLNPEGLIAGDFQIELEGEATMAVESPSGMILNSIKNTFPSAALYSRTLDDDAVIDEFAQIDVMEQGAYTISVQPRTIAAGGNNFNLRYSVNGTERSLVSDGFISGAGYQFIVYPAGVAAISPYPGEVKISGNVTLTWPDAGQVNLEIARDPAFLDLVADVEVEGGSYSFAALVAAGQDTTAYYWRTTPVGETGLGEISGKIGVFWVTDVATAVDDEEDVVLPHQFRLAQNYPNPFNPTTRIEFELAEASFVTLEVRNLLGQKVRTLVAEPLNAGVHQAIWNGQNDAGEAVASGLYFYRLDAADYSAVKKMILLK